MLEDSNDVEFLRSPLAESIAATGLAIFLLLMPFLFEWAIPGKGSEIAEDMGILMAGSVLILIFRTRDIFPAVKRLKELKKIQEETEES